jgi:Tol biopolymer transport system component
VILLGVVGAASLVLGGVWRGVPGEGAIGALSSGGGLAEPTADPTGRLLVPREGGLWLVRLPGRDMALVHHPGQLGSVTSARWAPDGQAAAYALSYVRPDEPTPRSEIHVTDFAGQTRRLVARDRPESMVSAPAWAPDGRALFYAYAADQGQLRVRRIERLDIDSGARTVVMDGTLPAVSPDGTRLAAVHSDGRGESLVLAGVDGSAPRTLLPLRRFGPRTILGAPRFSPDGRTLAIPVSGTADQATAPRSAPAFGLLGASVALAHGDPWDVYLVDSQGGEPSRLTHLAEDDISVAWSPDGTRLAVYGGGGIYLVDRAGRAVRLLENESHAHADLDWSR